MMNMYSKLFNAGLNVDCALPRTPYSPSHRDRASRRRTRSSSRSSWPVTSPSSIRRPALNRRPSSSIHPLSPSSTLEIASPTGQWPPSTPSQIYFTFKNTKPRSSPRKSPKHSKSVPLSHNRNTTSSCSGGGDLRSFLSLDLAESIRTGTVSSKRSKREREEQWQLARSFYPSIAPSRRNSSCLPIAKPAPSRSSALPALPSTSTFIHHRQSTTTTAPTLSSRPSIVKRAYRHNALAALEGRHKRSFWDTEEEEEDAEDAEMQFQHDSITSRLSMPITPDTIASSTVLETPIDYPLQEVSLNVHKPSVLSRPQPLFDISPLKISDPTTIAGSDSENWSFFSPTSDASSVPTEVTGYFVEFDFERKRKAAARVSESSVWATLIGAS